MTHRFPLRRLSSAVLVTVALFAGAQTVGTQQRSSAQDVITEASIRGHMEFLASDAMKGRGSGTEDEWRAAVYIGSQMRRWEIEPLGDNNGFVKQIDTGRGTVSAPPTLSIGGTTLTHGREMLVQSIGRGSTTGQLWALYAGHASPSGSFVVVPPGVTPAAADTADAAGVLTVETSEQRAAWTTTGAQLPGTGRGGRGASPTQARIVLAKSAYDSVVAAMGPGTARVTMFAFKVETKPSYTWDAIGELKGSDPAQTSEVILLTAHLDHLGVRGNGPDTIYNGADDDASGSIAVLELAEAIAKGPRPKRTIIFAWFGSEESGGAGARDFLQHPPVPLPQIVANLEFEMIANRDSAVPPHTLWLTGYDCSTLGPDLANQGAKIVNDPHPEQGFFMRSDNIQLARTGVVAQTVSSFDVNRKPSTYHQPTDEISTVDFPHMTDSIRSMFDPVLWLANSTYKPTWLAGKDPSKGGNCGARPGRGGE